MEGETEVNAPYIFMKRYEFENEINKRDAIIAALRADGEKLRCFVRHDQSCRTRLGDNGKCDCGYVDVIGQHNALLKQLDRKE